MEQSLIACITYSSVNVIVAAPGNTKGKPEACPVIPNLTVEVRRSSREEALSLMRIDVAYLESNVLPHLWRSG